MQKNKSININGLILDGTEPIHPVVLEYFRRKGAELSQALGYVQLDLDNAQKIPDTHKMLEEMEDLSLEMYGKGTFYYVIDESKKDLEFKIVNLTLWARVSINFKDADNLQLWHSYIAYLQSKNAIVEYTDTKLSCEGGDFPEDDQQLEAEMFEFITAELQRLEAEKAAQPGLFASYYNWIFGGPETEQAKPGPGDGPKLKGN